MPQNPTTEEILATAMDIAEDITTIRWTGSVFQTVTASPLEGATEILNGAQSGVMFDWYRFDTPPTIRNFTPTGLNSFETKDTINISVNVTDNINVSKVFALVCINFIFK